MNVINKIVDNGEFLLRTTVLPSASEAKLTNKQSSVYEGEDHLIFSFINT